MRLALPPIAAMTRLEVLIMIVRRHVVHLAEHLIGFTVIDDINEKIEVHAAHGTLHNALAFTGSETRQVAVHDIRRSLISGKREAVLVLAFPARRATGSDNSQFPSRYFRSLSEG